ncbi:mechanosensitive ion channel family protein [Texcoconibacillus texcoconensis]|uniref:Small conductance mechanosensitive channel n=1 Tax=Texcoconibacillus texcoconensis TaxID=1095777 RepID=A0A840QLM9_9BACI|nr:mechanosensitive ion channel family protein [Texcoconibacillus texcoconensis]MBB5172250.1 small conductance mechanosensitive channel [Texcoconibacillus texcoconensis]
MTQWFNSPDWTAIGLQFGKILLQLIVIFIVYGIVKRIAQKMITRSFERMQKQRNMSTSRNKTLEKLAQNVFGYALLFVLITIVIGLFDYDVTALIAGAGIIGLAIGFGAQGLVSDVVTGFFILLEKQLEVDEYITVAGVDGIVEEVGLRTTRIRSFNGTVHFIPNREITSLSNHSRGTMQALVDISIAYKENINEAITVMQTACDAASENDETIVDGPHVIGVQHFGDSDVIIRIIAKTENMEQWAVERKLRQAIKEALDKNGIEIPFPHHVILDQRS